MGDSEYLSIEDPKLEDPSFSTITNPHSSTETVDVLQDTTEANSNSLALNEQEVKEKEQEVLLNRLKEIPHSKLKELITNQLDLEIQLKHRELNLNHHEIGKIESQILILRKFLEISNDNDTNEPNEFTVKYFELLKSSMDGTYNNFKNIPESSAYHDSLINNPNNEQQQQQQFLLLQQNHHLLQHPQFNSAYLYDSSNGNSPIGSGGINSQPTHSYRTRSTTSSLRPSTTSISSSTSTSVAATGTPAGVPSRNSNLGCLYRRTDGIIVRLTCPICQRSNFSSAQGFLNHSRIAHSKEFTSQDAAALKCGEILPEIKQDSIGEASIKMLIEKGVDPNNNLNVNEFLFGGNTHTTTTSAATTPKPEASPQGDNEDQDAKSQPQITTCPTPHQKPIEKLNELMKKLVKEGKMKKEEYEKLLKDTKEPTINSHLFADEVEEDENSDDVVLSKDPSVSSLSNLANINDSNKSRRVSRGGINILIANAAKEEQEQEQDQDEEGDAEEARPPVQKKQKKK